MSELLGKRRSRLYNCASFAADVWEHETGHDIRAELSGFLSHRAMRDVRRTKRKRFARIRVPRSPCLVLFRAKGRPPHCGVYVRGRVLHLGANTPIRQDVAVASFGFDSIAFYAHS